MASRSFSGAVKLRFLAIGMAACACVLIFILLASLSFLWLVPWLWLVWGEPLVHEQIPRILLFLLFLQLWIGVNAASMKDLLAIRTKKRARSNLHWSVAVPETRQPWAAELLRFVDSNLGGGLHSRLQVRFCFVPGVQYERMPRGFGGRWQISVGFSALAALKTEEVYALALEKGFSQLRPVTRVHVWLVELSDRVSFWKSALPPHSGVFSLTRWGLESLNGLLRPVSSQLKGWSFHAASAVVGEKTLKAAQELAIRAGQLHVVYARFFRSINTRGLMPPYTEGLARFCGTMGAMEPLFAFQEIEGLWVYERQFLENTYGRNWVGELRAVNWDDLRGEVDVAGWRENTAHIRPTLEDARVADIPALLDGWRTVFRKWLLSVHKAPTVTPDRQRVLFVELLSAAWAEVLFDAGWEIRSGLGEEVCFEKCAERLQPFRLVRELAVGRMSKLQFEEICRQCAVADLKLGLNQSESASPGE